MGTPSPGESPFRTKGLVYLGARDFYATRIPGGIDAVGGALPPELRPFWAQLFLASGQYDILPIVDISRAAAKVARVAHRELVIENARWLAERDIHGVYRLLLKLASPRLVAMRLPKVAMQYFDFGTASGERLGDDAMAACQQGVPAPLVAWMTWAVEGFAPVALATAGARETRVRIVGDERDGEHGGIETRTLRWQLHWK